MPLLSRLANRTVKHVRGVADRRRLGGLYGAEHDNVDRGLHLHEAVRWLERAQDAGDDRGVSYGARFGDGFLASYPETTGYIIVTFIELWRQFGDAAYLERARAMGDWEIAVQLPSGAVMGGKLNSRPTPAIFNTGQVLLGWSALFAVTGDGRYASAARRAADWMVEMQGADGQWRKGNSEYALPSATVYNVKAAWGLAEAGTILDVPAYVDAAVRNAEFCLRKQQPNGWFDECCLTDPTRPLLHTLAYAMQGLLGIGTLTGHERFIDAAQRTAQTLESRMREDGFLAGRYDHRFRERASWCCLTGSAQTAIVWSELHLLGRAPSFGDAVRRVIDYLCRRHDVTNDDPTLRGGVCGSWPVWGEYGQYKTLNWATKFFVDALLREERIVQAAAKSR